MTPSRSAVEVYPTDRALHCTISLNQEETSFSTTLPVTWLPSVTSDPSSSIVADRTEDGTEDSDDCTDAEPCAALGAGTARSGTPLLGR